MGGKRRPKSPESTAPTGIARLLSETPVATVDLHGLTGAQASARARDFVLTHSRVSKGRVIHIVTGRGARSEGAPVLPGVVNGIVRDELPQHVEEVAGLPGGGGLAIRIR